MKSPLTCSILLLSALTLPAHAGWFDDLFGGGEEQKTEQTQPATQALADNPLVSEAMGQLGLNQKQAEGGLGTLLNVAKSSLDSGQFSELTKDIPGADLLMAAAPLLEQNEGMSGLLSKAGDLGQSLQGGAMVYDAFEKLGISKDLAMPMVNLLKQYLQQNSGNEAVDLLSQGLNSFL
ncbi:DUF2780 domain-containing protein [Shewanella corallii]|uniref:DUF2780 domain-containing protein n=1 Tax=Shewanella corallii TaxID=560080 RepID=A0ABT0N9V7_9GAMM|nr:DUF2780 domain-containing protein [Shewanella corallii]MCL2915252.1 DUF2780 domain-containing protein [Shewanella corallii]